MTASSIELDLMNITEMDANVLRHMSNGFRQIDTDESGRIDRKEFQRFLIKTNQHKDNKYLFDIADANHDGTISLDEFLKLMISLWQMSTTGDGTAYTRLIFNTCDVGKKRDINGKEIKKGYLTYKEFVKFMKISRFHGDLGFFDRKKLFRIYDEDGDSKIRFEEIMTKLRFRIVKQKPAGAAPK